MGHHSRATLPGRCPGISGGGVVVIDATPYGARPWPASTPSSTSGKRVYRHEVTTVAHEPGSTKVQWHPDHMNQSQAPKRTRWPKSPWIWPPVAIVCAALAGDWFSGTGAAAAFGLVAITAFVALARVDKPLLDWVRRRQKTARKPPSPL